MTDMTSEHRVSGLEGLRGVCAWIVVVYHALGAFGPALLSIPVFTVVNGTVAVHIFFVHSGFVLALRPLREGGVGAAHVRRIIRLLPMCLVCIALAQALVAAGLMMNAEAAERSQSAWFAAFYRFDATLTDALWETWRVFFLPVNSTAYALNPPFWTLRLEFEGSLLVYALLGLGFSASAATRGAAVVLAGGLFPSLTPFLAGLVLAELWHHRRAWWVTTWARVAVVVIACLGIAALFMGYQLVGSTVFATACVAGTLASQSAARILGSRPGTWLGGISFGVYGIHFPVLAGPAAAAFLAVGPGAAATVLVAVTLIGASVLRHTVDLPSIIMSWKVGAWLEARRPETKS